MELAAAINNYIIYLGIFMNAKYLRRKNYMFEAMRMLSDERYVIEDNINLYTKTYSDKNKFLPKFLEKNELNKIFINKK